MRTVRIGPLAQSAGFFISREKGPGVEFTNPKSFSALFAPSWRTLRFTLGPAIVRCNWRITSQCGPRCEESSVLFAYGRLLALLVKCRPSTIEVATGKRSALPSVLKVDIEGSPFESHVRKPATKLKSSKGRSQPLLKRLSKLPKQAVSYFWN